MYTIKGDTVTTSSVDRHMHITVSPVTGDVAVACSIFGTTVYSTDLMQLKYKYKVFNIHNPTLGEMFSSSDAVYDTEGHLLIGDTNQRVHICEANTGKVLKRINLKLLSHSTV